MFLVFVSSGDLTFFSGLITKISGNMTQISGDMTSGNLTVNRSDIKAAYKNSRDLCSKFSYIPSTENNMANGYQYPRGTKPF